MVVAIYKLKNYNLEVDEEKDITVFGAVINIDGVLELFDCRFESTKLLVTTLGVFTTDDFQVVPNSTKIKSLQKLKYSEQVRKLDFEYLAKIDMMTVDFQDTLVMEACETIVESMYELMKPKVKDREYLEECIYDYTYNF